MKGRKDMRRFVIIIEQGSHNYSAYVPDLPGCIATGKTVEEVKANMREAIPAPHTLAEYVDIAIPDPAA
jgi:predicted RNase H-like HicB family nuclease